MIYKKGDIEKRSVNRESGKEWIDFYGTDFRSIDEARKQEELMQLATLKAKYE